MSGLRRVLGLINIFPVLVFWVFFLPSSTWTFLDLEDLEDLEFSSEFRDRNSLKETMDSFTLREFTRLRLSYARIDTS